MEALKVSRQIGSWNLDGLGRGDQGMKRDIARIEGQMKEGFVAVDKRFAAVDARFDKVDARFEKIEGEMKDGFARVDQEMKAGFDKVDERFDKVDERFDKVDERFDKIDEKFERLYRMLFAGLVVILGALVGVPAIVG